VKPWGGQAKENVLSPNGAALHGHDRLRQNERRSVDVPPERIPMSQSLAKVVVHLVYSTKHRTPWLREKAMRDELYADMATILRDNVDSPAIIINGVEDHLHALILLSRKFALMDVIKVAKTETSKWVKKQSKTLADFSWQSGYGAFSVSESNIPQVKKYIQDQEEHHRRMTFQDEFRELCRRHNVELDERYAWD
jgi:REP-associated tyrosine transposase